MEENKNEIMVADDEIEAVDPEVEEESSGLSTGAAVALGSLLTLGVIAGVRFAKKKYNEFKAKREEKSKTEVDQSNVIDITDVKESDDN